jgi:hypothetical protein
MGNSRAGANAILAPFRGRKLTEEAGNGWKRVEYEE